MAIGFLNDIGFPICTIGDESYSVATISWTLPECYGTSPAMVALLAVKNINFVAWTKRTAKALRDKWMRCK